MSDEARKAEASGASEVTFDYNGVTFAVPSEYNDWPLDFIEGMLGVNRVADLALLHAMLTPADYATVKGMRLKGAQITEMSMAMLNALGITTGESKPSGS